MRGNWFKLSVLFTVILAVAGVVSAFGPYGKPAAHDNGKLIVHEWGTFTSFSGSDGKLLNFPHNSDDLPPFVHRGGGRERGNNWGSPSIKWYDGSNHISLETPVLYFYTAKEQTVSVKVDFPQGWMTEWYPQVNDLHVNADSIPLKALAWKVKLLPGASVAVHDFDADAKENKSEASVLLPRMKPYNSHYYPARETDAVPLQVGTEQEKLLFYRGVADFVPPIAVKANKDGTFTIKNSAKNAVSGLLLLDTWNTKVSPSRLNPTGIENRMRFVPLGDLDGGKEKTAGFADVSTSDTEDLGKAMVRSLVQAGLFEKEARAMVKTWKADWFSDPGTRVLYIAPTPYADELLPLNIEPKPAKVVRVLVGRHDILTPAQESAVEETVKNLQALEAKQAAIAAEAARPGVDLKQLQALEAERSRIRDQIKNWNQSLNQQQLGRFATPAMDAAKAKLKK